MVNNSPVISKSEEKMASVNSSSAEEFRQLIEIEVLKLIGDLFKKRRTPKKKIQEIARRSLELIKPGMSLDQLYQNMVQLDDYHPELSPVVFKLMKEYEQKYEKRAIEQVSNLVRSGKYDQAQELVKKVLEFKIQDSKEDGL